MEYRNHLAQLLFNVRSDSPPSWKLFCNPALGCCPLVVHNSVKIIIIIIIAPFINVMRHNMNKNKNDYQGYNDRNYYISQ